MTTMWHTLAHLIPYFPPPRIPHYFTSWTLIHRHGAR